MFWFTDFKPKHGRIIDGRMMFLSSEAGIILPSIVLPVVSVKEAEQAAVLVLVY